MVTLVRRSAWRALTGMCAASLFPDHAALSERTHIVTSVTDSPKPPSEVRRQVSFCCSDRRLHTTARYIHVSIDQSSSSMRANAYVFESSCVPKCVAFLATGENKNAALKQVACTLAWMLRGSVTRSTDSRGQQVQAAVGAGACARDALGESGSEWVCASICV
jgi:hypothetical protein